MRARWCSSARKRLTDDQFNCGYSLYERGYTVGGTARQHKSEVTRAGKARAGAIEAARRQRMAVFSHSSFAVKVCPSCSHSGRCKRSSVDRRIRRRGVTYGAGPIFRQKMRLEDRTTTGRSCRCVSGGRGVSDAVSGIFRGTVSSLSTAIDSFGHGEGRGIRSPLVSGFPYAVLSASGMVTFFRRLTYGRRHAGLLRAQICRGPAISGFGPCFTVRAYSSFCGTSTQTIRIFCRCGVGSVSNSGERRRQNSRHAADLLFIVTALFNCGLFSLHDAATSNRPRMR